MQGSVKLGFFAKAEDATWDQQGELFEVDCEGSDLAISWMHAKAILKEVYPPRMLFQVHEDRVLMQVWDSDHEEPLVSFELGKAGQVIGGEINKTILRRLETFEAED